jgi:hypothetical protein
MSFAQYYPDGRQKNAPAKIRDDGQVEMAGFDDVEGVHKVAMMVWNASLLSWERGSSLGGGGGGGGGSVAGPTTKRFDKFSATVFYSGEAEVGTAESAASWGIKKITFDTNGNATASFYAVGAWSNRYALGFA